MANRETKILNDFFSQAMKKQAAEQEFSEADRIGRELAHVYGRQLLEDIRPMVKKAGVPTPPAPGIGKTLTGHFMKNPSAVGAAVGAGAGYLLSDDQNKGRNALIGGVAGGFGGGALAKHIASGGMGAEAKNYAANSLKAVNGQAGAVAQAAKTGKGGLPVSSSARKASLAYADKIYGDALHQLDPSLRKLNLSSKEKGNMLRRMNPQAHAEAVDKIKSQGDTLRSRAFAEGILSKRNISAKDFNKMTPAAQEALFNKKEIAALRSAYGPKPAAAPAQVKGQTNPQPGADPAFAQNMRQTVGTPPAQPAPQAPVQLPPANPPTQQLAAPAPQAPAPQGTPSVSNMERTIQANPASVAPIASGVVQPQAGRIVPATMGDISRYAPPGAAPSQIVVPPTAGAPGSGGMMSKLDALMANSGLRAGR